MNEAMRRQEIVEERKREYNKSESRERNGKGRGKNIRNIIINQQSRM